MINLASLLLALSLVAAPAPSEGDLAGQSDAPAPAAVPVESPAAVPAAPAAASPVAPPVVKPSEADIEVLTEVVDLQETEDPAAAWYGKGYPERIRMLALPTARTVRKGGFDFIIDHRAARPIYDSKSDHPWSDMGNDFLGLDGAMRVGLGLRYGILDGLDAGVYRAGGSAVDTYELDVRYQALRQEELGVDLAVRAGATWFAQRNVEDSHGFFGQVLATRTLVNRLVLSAGLLYHSNSTNATKYNQDKSYSAAWAAAAELRLAAPVSLDAEVVSCTFGYCSKNPAFSGGVKFFTSRHTFALVCGNTQYLTADGYVSNTDTPWKNLAIGFNITREY